MADFSLNRGCLVAARDLEDVTDASGKVLVCKSRAAVSG